VLCVVCVCGVCVVCGVWCVCVCGVWCVCVCGVCGVCVCVCVCILAFLFRHAKRMRHIILSPVAYLAVPSFSTFSHKRHDFRKSIEHKSCVFILSTITVQNLSYSKKRDISINACRLSGTVPVILVRFGRNLNFIDTFSKNPYIRNFIKISPEGDEVSTAGEWRTDRRT